MLPGGLKNLRHHPPNAFLICLKHTLIHWALLKTHQFENAVETGSKQKHIYHVSVYIQKTCVYSLVHRVQLMLQNAILIVSKHFSVDSQKCIKTEMWTGIHQCVFDDNENA